MKIRLKGFPGNKRCRAASYSGMGRANSFGPKIVFPLLGLTKRVSLGARFAAGGADRICARRIHVEFQCASFKIKPVPIQRVKEGKIGFLETLKTSAGTFARRTRILATYRFCDPCSIFLPCLSQSSGKPAGYSGKNRVGTVVVCPAAARLVVIIEIILQFG